VSANRRSDPHKLRRLIRGELDWIVMKALEKDRNRRYETTNEFALDVQRYLADEPVQACPPSAGYRLRKFVRRNRGPAVAASVILFCLLAGIVGTTAGLVWAVRERDKKGGALIAETNAREAEKQARDRAFAALRDMTDEFVENQMARDTYLTEENKAFLRTILRHFEGFAAITADDAESRAIRAEGHARVARMRGSLGQVKEAEAASTDALALYRQLVADFPGRPEFRRHLAVVQNNRCSLFRAAGRLKEAEAACRDALALRKQLADESPARPEFRRDLALSYANLGAVLFSGRRPKEAELAYADALALYTPLDGEFPNRLQFRRELAISHNGLGAVFHETGRPGKAETAYQAALAIRKELAREYPGRPELRQELARSHYNLGTLFQATRRLKEAEAAYAAALALQKPLARDYPNWRELRQDLSSSHNNLAIVFDATGRPKEAEAALADALALFRQLVADFPNEPQREYFVAGTCVSLADFRLGQRDFKGAKAYLDDAVGHQEAALKARPQSPDYRRCCRMYLTTLIRTDAGLGDQAGAQRAAEQLRDLGWEPPATAYEAGRALSLCIPLVQKDDQLDAAQRQAAVKFYGDQALAMLRAAVAQGYKDAEHMKQDKDLDAVREREDFKKLLAQLEAKEK
jgi:tetratricopeptide (TPR) repeat protein